MKKIDFAIVVLFMLATRDIEVSIIYHLNFGEMGSYVIPTTKKGRTKPREPVDLVDKVFVVNYPCLKFELTLSGTKKLCDPQIPL